MKSFSQFLQESYLSDGVDPSQSKSFLVRQREKLRQQRAIPGQDLRREAEQVAQQASRRPQGTTTTVPSSSITGQSIKALPPGKPGEPLTKPINQIPDSMAQGAYDAARRNPRTGTSSNPTAAPSTPSSSGKPPSGSPPSTSYRNVGLGKENVKVNTPRQQSQSSSSTSNPNIPSRKPGESTRDYATRRQQASQQRMRSTPSSSSSAIVPTNKPTTGSLTSPRGAARATDTALTAASNTSKLGKFAKFAGPASAALDTALSTADERAKGSGWARSLAKGATVAAGGLLGGTAGAIGGGGLLSAATGTAGAMAGGAAAEKAFDTVAGANARERAAMAKANRQRQAGSSLKGIGGPTSFSQRKPGGPAFMSTGVGSQRKTVQLAKTGVVNRGGQSTVGHLAFKNGQAVYKAGQSAQSLAKTSSNPLERIGRSLFAGAYKQHDAAKAQQALQRARQNDAARNRRLGVK